MPKEKFAKKRGCSRWPELEDHGAEWVSELRQYGYIVARNKTRAYALKWTKPKKLLALEQHQAGAVVLRIERMLRYGKKTKLRKNSQEILTINLPIFIDLLLG